MHKIWKKKSWKFVLAKQCQNYLHFDDFLSKNLILPLIPNSQKTRKNRESLFAFQQCKTPFNSTKYFLDFFIQNFFRHSVLEKWDFLIVFKHCVLLPKIGRCSQNVSQEYSRKYIRIPEEKRRFETCFELHVPSKWLDFSWLTSRKFQF